MNALNTVPRRAAPSQSPRLVYSAANDDRHSLWADESRCRRLVWTVSIVRCVIAPVFLFGLLLGTAHWQPATGGGAGAESQIGIEPTRTDYFPARYTNQASVAEDHIQAF